MAATRPILAITSIILLAGSIVLQFFIILSGAVTSSTPTDRTWFLQASTDGIVGGRPDLPNPVRWTYFQLCGTDGSRNAHCLGKTAALPFDPPKNFATDNGVPGAFLGTSHYYYLSRFAWAFFMIALVFAVFAFFMSVFAMCARLGSYLTGFMCGLALFFQILAASLMTAWTIQGRNRFHHNGLSAKVGTYAYAFSWTPVACLFISTLLFCVGGRVGGGERSSTGTSYFGRKRSTRSRGSFIESDGQRRVKEDYE